MALDVWTKPSGYDFGIYSERRTVNIPLPATNTPGVTYRVISGKLPAGLRISGSSIIGTPFEVPRTTKYRFVVRASGLDGIADRTFGITIEGEDQPSWVTPAGPLPIGSNSAYYVIDSSYIDFQLSAVDSDTASGQTLNYFIASDEGELPPGLILSPTGRISGFVQPLLAIPANAGDGNYGTDLYDSVAFDFGYRPTNGYDSYIYDSVAYGFSVPSVKPRKLNRNYEFIATITDGDTVTKRKFRIFVVGEDFFRADNVIEKAGAGVYTADITYVRAPIFTTAPYLGLRRANNYQTFKIDIYEGMGELGPVTYELDQVNAIMNGVARTELSSDNRFGSYYLRLEKLTDLPVVGYKINFNLSFTEATNTTYTITEIDVLGGDIYRLKLNTPLDVSIPQDTIIFIGDVSTIPPGMEFDSTTSEVFGVVPYQPAVTETYNFTIKAIRYGQGSELAISRRMFTVDILGEIESTITWITPTDLGSVDAGYASNLSVRAATTLQSNLFYTITEGSLPPGLNLNLDGELVGKVNQATDVHTYRSNWKPATSYQLNNVVKVSNIKIIKSFIRNKNRASAVTTEDHGFKNKEIVRIKSNILTFNQTSGIEIDLPKLKLSNPVVTQVAAGNWSATFTIPTQVNAPLSPKITNITGTSARAAAYNQPVIVTAKPTSKNSGAKFLINKGSGLQVPPTPNNFNYNGLTTITLLDPGLGYEPGDVITISGADLPGTGTGTYGQDGVNDLSFTTSSGLAFYYKVNGNSNSKYEGRFFSTASTTTSITLHFDENPGMFGSELISIETSPGVYEAQTQIVPLNWFGYYSNNKSTATHVLANGSCEAPSKFYKAIQTHTSGSVFTTTNWAEHVYSEKNRSITTLDQGTTTLDDSTTSIDRVYTFTITASDALRYSEISRTFNLLVNTPNNANYSNIFAKPFLKVNQRQVFRDFITDPDIFNPKLIYRLSDGNFGLQKDLRMLVFGGIETKTAAEYISAIGMNHRTKRFKLGQIKKAVAKEPGTNNILYEVVYVEVLDPLEKNKQHLPFTIKGSPNKLNITVDSNNEFDLGPFNIDSPFWKRPMPLNVTLDRTDIFAGDPATQYRMPSSISIWRKRIRNMPNTARERNYLPLWMRSIQANSMVELDYVPAVPLCFCKPGTADDIILNIENSGFDFKLLDYTIDRYIIDSVEGDYTDKYLVFRNDRTTIT